MRTAVRRHLSLLVSGALVLLTGSLGLLAGHAAGQQALEVHREDRFALQLRLAGLVEQYVLVAAAEVLDALDSAPPWSPVAGDPATTARLTALVDGTRALDHGAVLMSSLGQPLAAWTVNGDLPGQDDPGWEPLRDAVREGDGTLPVSGVLRAGDGYAVAIGLPVQLTDGSRALLLGLWDPERSPLQQYVSTLTYGKTGRGYVLDARGLALAGPDQQAVGAPMAEDGLRAAIRPGAADVVETQDGPNGLVTSYAPAGRLGWTAVTPQDRDEFQGALVRSSRLVSLAVMALVLTSGTALVVLHRKREGELEIVALYDPLTGVYNRRGWSALAAHELERARRQGSARVLLFVDVDGLKQVNDELGHREGDRAITAAAQVLTAASRSSDLVGRLGGDEFVLLLGEDGQADVARRRVVRALAEHNAQSGDGFELRLSLGAEVWFPESVTTLDELVRRADADMYADKSSRPQRSEGVVRVPSPRSAGRDAPVS